MGKLAKEFKSGTPFPHLSIPNFFDEDFLKGLKSEILGKLEFKDRINDLYQFKQSDDLKGSKLPQVQKLREILYSEAFRQGLESITGIQVDDLSEKVAINAAIYESTDRLLCHDDELEGRRIAFIVYMVEDWQEADAGHLDLFSVDKNG